MCYFSATIDGKTFKSQAVDRCFTPTEAGSASTNPDNLQRADARLGSMRAVRLKPQAETTERDAGIGIGIGTVYSIEFDLEE